MISGAKSDREDEISLELTEEILQSMEIGLALRHYLSTSNVKCLSSCSTLEVSFTSEGMYVISGSGDGCCYAWRVWSGNEVAGWMSTEAEPPVIKWAPGSLMFVTGSSELSFWIPDLSKLAACAGRK